ncbi:MAG: 50S ribosomal protein L11 methyltransferase [bacterium]|nr:50S ribosomal protein L11 methyltransferase [bacterium]
MNWNEIIIKVATEDCDVAAAIANVVVPHGIYVEDYSDLEQGAQEIAHIDLIDDQLLSKDRSQSYIHIYISEEENCFEILEFLYERFRSEGIDFEICKNKVDENDWADNWKKYFKVTQVGKRLVIRPIWENYDNVNNKAVINIDPGAAFGTGTHATTRMCLELLDRYVTDGQSVLDVGCGSGILSVASLLLGAESAVGVDIDSVAVKVAKENAKRNGVDNKVEYISGNLCDNVTGKYDIICANIVADAILMLTPDIKSFMKENSIYICSGIIDIRTSEVKKSLVDNGFKIIDVCTDENWYAFAAVLND